MGNLKHMLKKNLELLTRDLCSRIPYKIICCTEIKNMGTTIFELKGIIGNSAYVGFPARLVDEKETTVIYKQQIEKVKPYLFPMSLITEELKEQCRNEIGVNYFEIENINKFNYGGLTENVLTLTEHIKLINWLNRNYFDYNNLIGLDLAYSAKGLGFYRKIKNEL